MYPDNDILTELFRGRINHETGEFIPDNTMWSIEEYNMWCAQEYDRGKLEDVFYYD